MTETEKALRAEVSRVCRHYCLQVWNEALDQIGVEASSAPISLAHSENVYYPLAIHIAGPLGSKALLVSSKADEGKASPSKAPSTTNISLQEAR